MASEPLLMNLENNVYLEDDVLVIIDRRKLPGIVTPVYCSNEEEVASAIREMMVQGAGDIAITAGFGLYLAARELERKGRDRDRVSLEKTASLLRATRPTGFHMAALLDKIMVRIDEAQDSMKPSEIIMKYLNRAMERQREISRQTGFHAEPLITSGDTILTHCFAGPGLLYMFQYARDKGKEINVMCTETRPYLQGARLTAWSVSEMGFNTTLITDNMAAWCMSRGMIQKVFTAADRVAMDGTAANKVGTLQLAICARHYGIPFYILGYGGPDRRTKKGEDIPIEERDAREVLEFQSQPISGPRVKGYYPAFDLTPPELIDGVVTASGIQKY
ncbi:MAG: s-methyl-5-thioribose-1-phosphate isomerase [Syntrophales bacterium]|nr:s-methyl-5-thioribose-1-phosphate isomerase [Syntrophales bacterium]